MTGAPSGHDAAREAEISSGAPDATAVDSADSSHTEGETTNADGGTADTVDGALTPGSTADQSPTGLDLE